MTSNESRQDAPEFQPGGKQHERLGIPKEGLPAISGAEFDDPLAYLWRYEETLGLGGPGNAGEAEAVQDAEVLAQITSQRCKVSLGEARAILVQTANKHSRGRGRGITNSDEPTVIWESDHALAFATRLAGASSAVVASFLYIHQCDELAEGLFKPDDPEGWIQRTYEWALAHAT